MTGYPVGEYFLLDENSKLRSSVDIKNKDVLPRSLDGTFLCADKGNIFIFSEEESEVRVLDPFTLNVRLRFPFQGKDTLNFDHFPKNTSYTYLSYESGPFIGVPEI